MYEGDSGAPKERFVTLAELENAGLLTASTKNRFAFISELLGSEVSAPADAPTSTTIINNIITEVVDGGAGTNTLRDLLDTVVDSATGDDFLQYRSGAWRNFDLYGADITITGEWRHNAILVMGDGIGINWENSDLVRTEMLNMTGGAHPVADWTNVLVHCSFDGANLDTNFISEDASARDLLSLGGVTLLTSEVKFGTTSSWFDGDARWQDNDDAGAIGNAMDQASWCCEGWQYRTVSPFESTTEGHTLMGSFAQTSGYAQWCCSVDVDGEMEFMWSDDGVTRQRRTSFGADLWVINEWQHLAWSYDFPTKTLRMFSRGVMVYEDELVFSIFFTTALQAYFHQGFISDTTFRQKRFWRGYGDDYRLVVGEPVYTAPFDPPTAALPIGVVAANVQSTGGFTVGDPGTPTHIDGTRIEFNNNIGLTWLSELGSPVEMLALAGPGTGTGGGAAASGEPLWSNVELLLDFNGADEDVSFSSVDRYPAVWTASGGAKLDDTQVKFGTTSFYCTTAGDRMRYTSDNGRIGSLLSGRSFCIEGWMHSETDVLSSIDGGHCMVSSALGLFNFRQWALSIDDTGEVEFAYSETGGPFTLITSTGANLDGTGVWNHIAVSYDIDNTTLRLFANGALVYSGTHVFTIYVSTSSSVDVQVGKVEETSRAQNNNGWIDDVRIVVDEVVYTAAFTPPTTAHPIENRYTGGLTGGTVARTAGFIVGDPAYTTRIDGTLVELDNNIGLNWLNASDADVELLTLSTADVFTAGDPAFVTHIDGTLVELENNIGINWLNIAAADVELLVLNGGPPTLSSNWGSDPTTDWTYVGITHPEAALESTGICQYDANGLDVLDVSDDGLQCISGNNTQDRIGSFTLASPYDFSNATLTGSRNAITNPWYTVQWVNNGLSYMVQMASSNALDLYDSASAYVIDGTVADRLTVTNAALGFPTTGESAYWMSRDGTYLCGSGDAGSGSDRFRMFTLSTPYDITSYVFSSTLTYGGVANAPASFVDDFEISDDGLTLAAVENNDLFIGTMSVAFDVSTLVWSTGGGRDTAADTGTGGIDQLKVSADGNTIWVVQTVSTTAPFIAEYTKTVQNIDEIFVVGDPAVPTQIDGLTTNITSAATDIDGTLNVIGATDLDSTLNVGGSLTAGEKINVGTTTVITTSHTAAAEHVILVDDDTAAATVTITLPLVATAKTVYHIKKMGSTALVIIDGNGTETIDGALTATLTTQYESIMLVSDGIEWHVI
jgi:hypothetical protein